VPNFNQGRFEPYPVTIGANCGGQEVSQVFYITVQDMPNTGGPLISTTPTPTIVYTNQPAAVVLEDLKISDLKIEASTSQGDVTISWTTNKPASSRVIYDTVSQINKTSNFTYSNATVEDGQSVVSHAVILDKSKLEIGTTYYLRAVSKINSEVATSREIAFIKLANGEINTFGTAALLTTVGSFFGQPWLLWLIIVLLAIWLIKELRERKLKI
jgi:hypothetical protein